MKRIYLSLFLALSCAFAMASPDIFTPELVSPANNQTGSAPDVELDWSTVVGNTGLYYVLHLSTDEAFTNPVEFTTELSRYRMANLMFGGEYFWKVKAVDPSGSSDWSAVRKFTVITRPSLQRPNNNSTVDCNVEIQWISISGIGTFEFQFDTIDTFSSPDLRIYTAAGTLSKTNASLLYFGQQYFLRMRAIHAADTSDWSDVRNVTVLDEFKLKKPNNGTLGVAPLAELQWTEIKGISKYTIYISTDAEFNHFETYTAAKTLTKLKPDTLNFATEYFWRMAAIHSKDTLISDIWSFSTMETVSLSSPGTNSTNNVIQPTLSWTKISGALSYDLQIASTEGFDVPRDYNIEATTTSGLEQFKVPASILDSAMVYYWRVKVNTSRDTSDWCPAWNFRTAALGINDPVAYNNVQKIYPSPATSTVSIKLNNNVNGVAEVTLFDLLGKVRISKKTAISSGLIKDFVLGDLPDGIYMLQLQVNDIKTMSKIVVKK
ncbi:MAG: T9SS type A sorting domain-containing protein [Lentimicrobium sp.]|jgi:hypothetical protein|nr:T9SS type A sorting domain-containing protein [Lentimicrobium sp.]